MPPSPKWLMVFFALALCSLIPILMVNGPPRITLAMALLYVVAATHSAKFLILTILRSRVEDEGTRANEYNAVGLYLACIAAAFLGVLVLSTIAYFVYMSAVRSGSPSWTVIDYCKNTYAVLMRPFNPKYAYATLVVALFVAVLHLIFFIETKEQNDLIFVAAEATRIEGDDAVDELRDDGVEQDTKTMSYMYRTMETLAPMNTLVVFLIVPYIAWLTLQEARQTPLP